MIGRGNAPGCAGFDLVLKKAGPAEFFKLGMIGIYMFRTHGTILSLVTGRDTPQPTSGAEAVCERTN
jgi:hypothetical protein